MSYQPQPGSYPVSSMPVTGGAAVPPEPPPPPKRRIDLGWVVGGVTGSLAVLLAVSATLVGTGVFGGTSPSPAGGASSHTDESAYEYAFVEDMCSKLDIAGLEELAPLKDEVRQDTEEDDDEESYSVCGADFGTTETATFGALYASASRWKSKAAAVKDAKSVREPDPVLGELAHSELSGDWAFGDIATKFHPSTGSLRISVLIQDENFTAIAQATFTEPGGEISETELRDATVATAIAILQMSRKS